MPHSICVFPPHFSFDQASDCSKHRHVSKGRALALEAQGLAVRIDVFGRKFVERGPLGLSWERMFKRVPRAALSYKTMELALADESAEAERARRTVEGFGADIMPVQHLTYDQFDIWIQMPERGDPVLAAITHKNDETAALAEKYLALRWSNERVGIDEVFDMLSGRGQVTTAEHLLAQIWPEIAVQFLAGKSDNPNKFAAALNFMRPAKLPPLIVYWTIKAYLRK
jgi:hypothetical protein